MQPFLISAYRPADEQGWLRCRVLAFLDSAYFDDVHVGGLAVPLRDARAGPAVER